jgi:hypothetical protein
MGNEPIDWPALAALAITILITGFLLRRFLGKRHIQDRLMLRRLRVAGVKFDEPQNVGFIVFVKTEAQAGKIAERFRTDGFEPTIATGQIQFTRGQDKNAGPQNGWLVTLNRSMTIDPEEITRLRPLITEAAEGQAGLYLGWQVKQK